MTGRGQLLTFENVACNRGGRRLFEDIAFSLARGDALLVTGPNGVGKSSLLRIAANLLRAERGRVERNGAVALADENLALDPRLPLRDALHFWSRIDGGDTDAALAFGRP